MGPSARYARALSPQRSTTGDCVVPGVMDQCEGDALSVGLRHEAVDISDMCAGRAVGSAAQAAAEAAAAPLRARLAELEADAAPHPAPPSKTVGRDGVSLGFGCCGARLGDGFAALRPVVVFVQFGSVAQPQAKHRGRFAHWMLRT